MVKGRQANLSKNNRDACQVNCPKTNWIFSPDISSMRKRTMPNRWHFFVPIELPQFVQAAPLKVCTVQSDKYCSGIMTIVPVRNATIKLENYR